VGSHERSCSRRSGSPAGGFETGRGPGPAPTGRGCRRPRSGDRAHGRGWRWRRTPVGARPEGITPSPGVTGSASARVRRMVFFLRAVTPFSRSVHFPIGREGTDDEASAPEGHRSRDHDGGALLGARRLGHAPGHRPARADRTPLILPEPTQSTPIHWGRPPLSGGRQWPRPGGSGADRSRARRSRPPRNPPRAPGAAPSPLPAAAPRGSAAAR